MTATTHSTFDTNITNILSSVRAVLLDMDGVLYVGDTPLPGVQDFLDYLESTNRQFLCVTNNASRTSEKFAEKLASMNVRARPDQVLGSAQVAAKYLADDVRNDDGTIDGNVFMLGMEGLRTALLDEGFTLTDDPFDATYAVAGAHFQVTYDELADMSLAVRNGARFIGTNPDNSFPSERGQLPGTGSLLALLSAASGVEPEVVGKPSAVMYEIAMQKLGVKPHETLMVGDRYETDIVGAVPLGLVTAGVLTGITTATEFAKVDPPPTMVVDDLSALQKAFEAEGE